MSIVCQMNRHDKAGPPPAFVRTGRRDSSFIRPPIRPELDTTEVSPAHCGAPGKFAVKDELLALLTTLAQSQKGPSGKYCCCYGPDSGPVGSSPVASEIHGRSCVHAMRTDTPCEPGAGPCAFGIGGAGGRST